jgi:hypothetical protein
MDIVAAAQRHILDAVDDMNIPLGVHVADVSGA